MSASLISRAARLAVQDLLAAASTGFNAKLATACTQFGITSQAFTINFTTPGTNFFNAPYTLQHLQDFVSLSWPCMTLSTRLATDDANQIGALYSGPIEIEIGVYLVFDVNESTPRIADMESLPEAVESALIDILNARAAFVSNVSPPVQGSWTMDKTAGLEFIKDRFYLPVIFRASFHVTV